MTRFLNQLSAQINFPWASSASPSRDITNTNAFVGQDPSTMSMQFLIGEWLRPTDPTKDSCRSLFNEYRGRKTYPLFIVLKGTNSRVWVYGPTEDSVVRGPFDESSIARILQAALDQPSGIAARNLVVHYFDSLLTTAMPGVTNTGLFASHYLRTSAPDRPDWKAKAKEADQLLDKRGESLVKSLGFKTYWEGSSALLLKNEAEATRAVAVLLEESETFSHKSDRFLQSPVTYGLSVAQQREIPWLIALKGSQIRLYSAKVNQGVGRKGQSETYLEVDLAVVDEAYKPLIPLVFSASALAPNGSTEEFLKASSVYSVSLGKRLRDRVYEEVVPKLSVAVGRQMQQMGLDLDLKNLDIAYGATLRILFRLLFQAYGEDRSLLPYGKNSTYDRHALKTIAQELARNEQGQHKSIDQSQTSDSYWRDITNAWRVIDKGDSSWGVPAYNGGLFSSKDEEGKLLSQISLNNNEFIGALKSLLVDSTDDGEVGPVDFRSLSVREFGTIYEGLLESSLSLADYNLTLDKAGNWLAANPEDEIRASVGEPYFHNASGARKATGSYFTPDFLVDHLIDSSLVPALEKHLATVKEALDQGDEPKAAKMFFDFRVADLAMGSGHFLISAIDQIEKQMSAFLETSPIPQVADELRILDSAAKEALGDLALDVEIDPGSLLRRQIAKRCIYGLDINKIAVELARVAIWIHTFVPGLAMSSLDHSLVHGNSLTGIGTVDEALSELDPPQKGMIRGSVSIFRSTLEASLTAAANLLIESAAASEATAYDVSESMKISAQAKDKAEPSKLLFDGAVAARLGLITQSLSSDADRLSVEVKRPEIRDVLSVLNPAHMPYLFPEVFLRERPGFDVLVGNPPWEKIKIEEQVWWGLRIPGLRSMPQLKKNKVIKETKEARPDLLSEYLEEIKTTDFLRSVVSKGPYPGIGSGDIDLYQAFAWRNYHLLRSGGYLGIVLPRSALAGSGTKVWREEILDHASFQQVCLVANSAHWVFEDVHPQYNVGLVTVAKQPSDVVCFNGPFTSKDSFERGVEKLVEVRVVDFKSWSSTFVFPWLPTEESVDVFLQLRKHPRFDSKDGFEFRPVRELDTSIDKRFYDFDLAHPTGDIKVYTGGTFNLWDPDFGDPYAYAQRKEVIPFLENKLVNQRNNRRSAFYGLSEEALTPRPWERARIAFRNVTNSTNTRTVIACLLPPGVLTVEPSPFLLPLAASPYNDAYVLGIMCSIIFDWYSRRYIELHVTFELLNPMPIPRPSHDDSLRKRVVEIAGRLAAVDDRFADWAKAVDVPVGTVTAIEEKEDMIAELDAVVAHLYGLNKSQLEQIFKTFHVGWNYESRLQAVLGHFEQWQIK